VEIKIIDEPEELDEFVCCRFSYYYQNYTPPLKDVAVEESSKEI